MDGVAYELVHDSEPFIDLANVKIKGVLHAGYGNGLLYCRWLLLKNCGNLERHGYASDIISCVTKVNFTIPGQEKTTVHSLSVHTGRKTSNLKVTK